MKRILQITALGLLMVLGSSVQQKASAQFQGDITYQTFYDELSPYGDWIYYPEYGYVWQPDMGPDFRPYSSGGHWVWSDEYEWVWVSDYDWGWAPFHYGRWFNDPYYGWLWEPGYEWAPAWVAWRSGGDYYGWAPLRPGINISIGFSLGSYNAPYDYWCFAPSRYITSPRIYDYCVDRRQNVNFFNSTVIINNYNYSRNVFVTGPRRIDAERYIGGRINPVRFNQSSRPGRTQFRNNEVSIYRPNVQRGNENRFEPRNFERYDRNRVAQNDNRFDRNNNGDVRNGNNLPQGRNRNGNSEFERRSSNSNQTDRPGNNRVEPNADRNRNNNSSPIREQRPQQQERRQFEQRPQQQEPRQFEQRPQQQERRQVEQRPQQQERRVESREPQQRGNSNGNGNGKRRGQE
ncbi:MAG: DUF6600 domain-containing protein [Bacteroidota bacterium]